MPPGISRVVVVADDALFLRLSVPVFFTMSRSAALVSFA
jgi:hypothetical protein